MPWNFSTFIGLIDDCEPCLGDLLPYDVKSTKKIVPFDLSNQTICNRISRCCKHTTTCLKLLAVFCWRTLCLARPRFSEASAIFFSSAYSFLVPGFPFLYFFNISTLFLVFVNAFFRSFRVIIVIRLAL